MENSIFRCPVCAGGLQRCDRRYVCANGHSFDRAREGYVYLLPANQKHSKAPGDDKKMVAARTRFLSGDRYAPLRDTLAELIDLYAGVHPAVLDAGCGEGYYTASFETVVSGKQGILAGIDLSKEAVKKAAKRCRASELAVASLYRLPLADSSVDMIVNCFSPLAEREFFRAIKSGGKFIYVVPGPKHLWEMKEILYSSPYMNMERREDYPGFLWEKMIPVETEFMLETNQDIMDLYQMTPYAWKTPREGVERLCSIERLAVTAQFHIHVYSAEKAGNK